MASLILTGCCISAIIYLFYKYCTDRPSRYPPGPPKLPIFGSYLYFLIVNYKWLHRAAMYFSELYKSDIIGFNLGPYPTVVANSYEGIREIFHREEFDGRPDIFAGRLRDPHYERKGIFFNDGPIWKEQRRFILRYLREYGFGRRFQELELIINEELQELINLLRNGPKYPHEEEFFQKGQGLAPHMFSACSTNSLLHIIASERIPREEREINNDLTKAGMIFQRTGDDYGLLLSQMPWIRYIFPKLSGYTSLRNSNKVLYDFFSKYVVQNLQTFDEDHDRNFIDMYIRKVKEAEKVGDVDTTFEYDQFVLSLVDFSFPAITAIGTQVSLLFQRFLLNPEIPKRIQEEIDRVVGHGRLPCLEDRKDMPYTEAVIREGLRIETLVPSSIPHKALVDTELLGYHIPKDTIVIPGLDCFHQDKNIWKDPINFRPERFLYNNGNLNLKKDISLPFGAGRRLCAGETFARNMLFLMTSALCQNFDIVLGPNQALPDMSKTLNGIIISPPDFWIHFKDRVIY